MDNTLKIERIGYGFNRAERDFASLGCDRIFLDFKSTKRAARHDLLHMVGLRPGDVVVVMRESDLGYGVELKQIRELIAAAGARIEVAPQSEHNPTKAKTRGMDDDVKAEALKWWKPGTSEAYVNQRLAAEANRQGDTSGRWGPFTRAQFKNALGPKSKNV